MRKRNYRLIGSPEAVPTFAESTSFETPDSSLAPGCFCAKFRGDDMFEPIRNRLRRWHLRNITRRQLSLLDDRLLADIGTKRSGIADFVATQTDEGA
ncbi:hypothetical protein ASD83_16020 [Devosia sp. Root685]|nr:hypothetical protein ASD83_16020 [Devosia sp. Root685]